MSREEATADAVASLSLTPLGSQDVASAANPDQELKQAPGFPRLNIAMICNPHLDNGMNGLHKKLLASKLRNLKGRYVQMIFYITFNIVV